MPNPFYTYTLPVNAPFCNRIEELAQLESHALSSANVVLYSPRRYGKTSLVKKVQKNLADKHNAVTIFADFFGVTSVEDVAARLAKAVFAVTHKNEPLWKKALKTIKSFRPVLKPDEESGFSLSVEPASVGNTGLALLEETMDSLGQFIQATAQPVNIALDEFQEIVELKEALQVEAVMRTHIQHHKASYFFIGSRRRILLGIFNERQRPFFQSAFNFELKSLPSDELAEFIAAQFSHNGKRKCPVPMALKLASIVSCHPHYAQKLSYLVFEMPGTEVTENDIKQAMGRLLQAEEPVFEAILQGIPLQQKRIMRTIAQEPTDKPLANVYIAKYRLGSAGGVRHSLNQLASLDLVEKDRSSGYWKVIDPVFAMYLRERQVEHI